MYLFTTSSWKRTTMILFLLISLLLAACGGNSNGSGSTTQSPIKIGLISPLTGPEGFIGQAGLKGEISPILIGDCVVLPLPLLFPPHAARSKEITRKRIIVVRFQDEVVIRNMCFLLFHSRTFVFLDSRLNEWPTFPGRSFLRQE